LTLGATAGLGWGLACLVALLVVAVWLDLVVELPPRLRILAESVSLAAAAALAIGTLFAALRQGQPRRLAGRLDAAGQAGGQIVAGFDLAQRQPRDASPLSEGLAELAVDRAGEVASNLSPAAAVPARAARRSWLASASCAIVVALVGLAAPRLAQTEWLRFSDPFGDHPPFSSTLLTVEPGDTRVIYAGGLDVLVSASGPLPERVDLVLAGDDAPDAKGGEETLPMFPEADGKWKAQLSEIVAPCRYYARARGTRSHRYRIDVITVPRLETVRWRIVPPAYTGDAAYEGPTPSDGLAGLVGTQVHVWATSNRPLSRGSLTIDEDGSRRDVALAPPASDSREVSGRFEIRAAGKFALSVTDVAGQDSQEPFSGTITLLSDQRPLVRLMEPAEQSLATPTATLPVVVAAEDDYGVSRLQLFRSLNDSRALPLELDVTAVRRSRDAPQTSAPQAPRRLQQGTFLPLSTYQLEPGDVIKLYARVEDNDPASAKGTESAVATVQIISPEDYGRMLRAREGMDVFLSKYQEAQRRMESLAEEVEGLRKKLGEQPADSPAGEGDRRRLEELAEKLEQEAAAIRESAKELLPYDLDQALTSELERLAKQLDQAAGDARGASARPGAKAGDLEREMREMLERLQQEKKDFKQNVTEPLELLAEIYPLLEDQQRFVELYRRQRDLAERLASLAERGQVDPFDARRGEGEDDPSLKARMRDLEDEQRTLRDQLERLLDDIEEHAARIPDEPDYRDLVTTARDFAAAVRASAAAEEMQRAETGLAGFSGSEGHAGAKKAADILEQFISRCEGMGGQGEMACRGLKFAPQESLPGDCLANTLAQLLADAGFKQGNGAAMGSGGGYSARRSTLNNVGLYGNLPTRGNPTQARGGRRGAAVGGAGQSGTLADAGQSNIEDNEAAVRAAGASGVSVPARYRSRVQQYFQRIAEETGGAR
jgi:hypothetical protein